MLLTANGHIEVATALTTEPPSAEEMVKSYDWDSTIAYQVMLHEGGLDPEATNPEWHYDYITGEKICQGSYGLFQLGCIHANDPLNPVELKDARTNIEMAYELYKEAGWYPWSVCRNGTVDCGLN